MEFQSEEDILERIRVFADTAHGTQQRRMTGERYIVHPVSVMKICRQYTSHLPVLAAALLHDVLEDTTVGVMEMERFLQSLMPAAAASETLALVVELTDVYTKARYPDMNRSQRKQHERERLAAISAQGQLIKYADILDNAHDLLTHDPNFAVVFLREGAALLQVMEAGPAPLREHVQNTVQRGIEKLRMSHTA